MIYGTAALNGVPWETVIKVYRERLGTTSCATVQDYVDHLLTYLAADTELFTDTRKVEMVLDKTARFYREIRDKMIEAVEDAAKASGPLKERDARRVGLQVIHDHHTDYAARSNRADAPTGFADRIQSELADGIEAVKGTVFEDLKLPTRASKELTELAAFLMSKDGVAGDSGIVLAGFGTQDVFPRFVSYELDGVIFDHVVVRSRNTMYFEEGDRALVHGFAQDDVIHLFMEGVTEEYEQFVEGYVNGAIEQYGNIVLAHLGQRAPSGLKGGLRRAEAQIMDGLRAEFQERRRAAYVMPTLDVVGNLPKDELGSMAESLVTLTSLKRRISPEHETVGGPVDVAVITKGDGLVWTKRKHYFDAALNHHFFANYFRSASHGQA